jgi:hypothetical protein
MNRPVEALSSHLRSLDERADADLAVVNHQQKNAGPTVKSAPEPLRRPIPPPEPYPTHALGPILGPVCERLHRVIQAPEAICGAAILAAASLATQGLADVENGGRIYPLSLWMLSVAESGERKSAVDAEALRSAREIERTLGKAYSQAMAAYDIEQEAWGQQKEQAKRSAKGDTGKELVDALGALGPPPQEPLLPNVIAANFTVEGLTRLLVSGRPSVGIFTDEAALVFGGHGMTKESTARTAATLCKLWDCGELDRIRASDGVMKLYGRRVALHLMAQPVIAERALSDDVLSGQGFLARCLLTWPQGTAGTRLYRDESLGDDAAVAQYNARLAELLYRPLPLAEGERNELSLPTLRLCNEAKALWCEVHDAIEKGMGPGSRYTTCKPWASKSPEQCLRIAGVLTLIDNPDAKLIEAEAIERAAELALWHLNEAVRLAGTAETAPEIRNAEALLNWCHESGRRWLYSSDALQKGPAKVRDRRAFMQAVTELERAGWAEHVKDGMPIEGRHRKHVWQIVPKSEEL